MIGSWRRSKKLFKNHLKTFRGLEILYNVGTLYVTTARKGVLCIRYHSFVAVPINSPYLNAFLAEANKRRKVKADIKRWLEIR